MAYITPKDILEDRYLRKLETLAFVSADSGLPYLKVLAWLSKERSKVNKGNSLRTQKDYLRELALADLGRFNDDAFILSDLGVEYLRMESLRLGRWFHKAEGDIKRMIKELRR